MPHKIHFYFIRHAQSKANISEKNLIGGHNIEVELTPTGENQAKDLGVYLKEQGIQFDKAYCSTAVRTQQTAQLCFEKMGATLDLNITKQLLEQSPGGWEGQSRAIYQRTDVRNALDTDNWTYIPGDSIPGESQKMVAERMKSWVDGILAECQNLNKDQHIIVFSHGLAIKFLLAVLLDLDRPTAYRDQENPIANASITQLTYQESKLILPLEKRNFCAPKQARSYNVNNNQIAHDSLNHHRFFSNSDINHTLNEVPSLMFNP